MIDNTLRFEDGFIKKQSYHPPAQIPDIDMHGVPLDPRTPMLKDIIPLVEGIEERALDKETTRATKNVREVVPLFKTIYPVNRLYQGKPLFPRYSIAFVKSPLMLSSGKYNVSSYADKQYVEACVAVCNQLDKIHDSGLNRDDYLMLLTDFGMWPMLSNQIRTDGRWQNPKLPFQKEKMDQFRRHFAKYMMERVIQISDEELLRLKPKMHVTKSVGFYTVYSDGRPFNSSQAVYDLYKQPEVKDKDLVQHSAVARKFTGQNKQDWMTSGALLRNFDYAIECGRDILLDKTALYKGMSLGAVSVHTEAFRNNEYDEFIDLPSPVTLNALRDSYDKDRVVSFFSRDGSSVFSGTINNRKYNKLLKEKLPDHLLKKAKHRSMFPGSMNSIEPAYIYAYRLFNLPLESQLNGFLSLERNSLDHFLKSLERIKTCKGVIAIVWDGSNSEQIISDNSFVMCNLYPHAFEKIFHASNTAILSDFSGPRAALDVTPSGGAQTSSNNMHFHEFYKLEVVERMTNVRSLKDVMDLRERMLLQMFGGGDSFIDLTDVAGPIDAIVSKKGLDDQFCVFGSNSLSSRELCNLAEQRLKEFFEKFHYKYEVFDRDSDNCVFKFFGLFVNIKEATTEYRSTNSIGSLPRIEHISSGNVAGLHYYKKWSSLPPGVQRIFDKEFSSRGFIKSSFAEYEPCAKAAFKEMMAFGFSVSEFANEYQPASQLLWGSELTPFDIVDDASAYQYDADSVLKLGHRIQQILLSNGIAQES